MNIPLLLNLVSEAYRIAAEQSRLPSDLVLRNYFRQKSFLGKRDRQSISRIFWHALRHKSRLEWEASGEASSSIIPVTTVETLIVRAYRDLYPRQEAPVFRKEDAVSNAWEMAESETLPKNIPVYTQYSLPEWIWNRLTYRLDSEALKKMGESLLHPGGFHLRVNTLKSTPEDVMEACPEWAMKPGRLLPEALRLKGNRDITRHTLYRQGKVEIQDEGSQLISRVADPRKGDIIIDACAGAGGKSLHLAALTQNKAGIIATDKYSERLVELIRRAGRAGARLDVMDQKEVFKTLRGKADSLILDVPCSGSGTFRRRPDLKWNLTPARVHEYVTLQRQILDENIPLLKSGGRLIYATCSILPEENEEQMEYILQKWPALKAVSVYEILKRQDIPVQPNPNPWMRLNPHDYDTDGYFMGVMSYEL